MKPFGKPLRLSAEFSEARYVLRERLARLTYQAGQAKVDRTLQFRLQWHLDLRRSCRDAIYLVLEGHR